ncbi:MAG: HAMP domain-containing protein [Caldilineales bacterium]|nr:HAMP domain-containing protein [Caldilineales bacterium]
MNLLTRIRSHLGWKLMLSYLVVIAAGAVVLVVMVQVQTPSAIARHIQRMASHIASDPGLEVDLQHNFTSAISEVTLVAAVAAVIVAVVVSLFTARRIVTPIHEMMAASQRIAEGNYQQRVFVPSEDELGGLATSFNQMADTLERTEQRRLELIGDVAHELRTPLSNIRSVMEGLIDGVLPAEPATYQGVQSEVSRLQRLVHDLQELSKAEAGQAGLELRPIEPAALIAAATQRLRLQFEDKGVRLQEDVPGHLPEVLADAARSTQVLLNLLGNALQYTPEGGEVTVTARQQGAEVVFLVKDTGIGIAPEHLPHLFERFYRVDKSRSRAGGGSGIGLTISRHWVEAQGGRIWGESEGEGRGSTFGFTLPTSVS